MLWESSLVMIDQETESLWSHLLGECMKGPLKGETLEIIPSVMSDWKAWKQRYPETSVVFMERTDGRYLSGHKLVHADLMMGLVLNGQARAWPFFSLEERHFIQDELQDTRLLVTFDTRSATASVFDRSVGDKVLEFEWRDERLVDQQTGSTWDVVTGQAVEGPFLGEQMRRLPGVVSNPAVWGLYHEDGTMWNPRDAEPAPNAESEPKDEPALPNGG